MEWLVRGYLATKGGFVGVMQNFVDRKERDSSVEIAINPCNFHFQQTTIYKSDFLCSVPYQFGIRVVHYVSQCNRAAGVLTSVLQC